MTFQQLEYFADTCYFGNSMSTAAKKRGISKTTISQAISALETEFSITLFQMKGKQCLLTSEGEEFLRQSETILLQAETLCNHMLHLSERPSCLNIGINLLQSGSILPGLISMLKDTYPECEINITEAMAKDLASMLEEGKLSFAILNYSKVPESLKSKLDHFPIKYQEHTIFCTYPGHLLASKSIVSYQDIANETLVIVRGKSSSNVAGIKQFSQYGIMPTGHMIHVDQISSVFTCLIEKTASTIIAEEAVPDCPYFIKIPLEDDHLDPISIVTSKNLRLSHELQNLIQSVRTMEF